MKILVTFKRVPDQASAGAEEKADASKWVINPFDEIAIEEALRIRERGGAREVVGVTISTEAGEEQVRTAFGMGLDRAIRVQDERTLDPHAVSQILAGVVRREQPDLVLMGKQAVDDDANQTGQMLAGRLGWPQATFISKIEIDSEAKEAVCTRETDAGVEVIVVDLPAVITADLRLNEPRYVSLPSLIKARRRSIEVTTAEELGVKVQPRTGVVSYRVAPRRAKGILVADVQELLTRLRDNDKVI